MSHDQDHWHDHQHDHGHDHGHDQRLAPSGDATVMLDIGGAVGALVVHTPARLAGEEIEIAHRGDTAAFVHTEVRERRLRDGSVYAAVFAAVPAGTYRLLDAPAATRDIVVSPGRVTEVTW